jgi:hypothetical protein
LSQPRTLYADIESGHSLRIMFMDRMTQASTSCWENSRKSGTSSSAQDIAVCRHIRHQNPTDGRSSFPLLGDGFHSDGARLGGSHATPQHIGRIKGLEAAERRRVKSTLMGTGGRLGGAVPRGPVKSPRCLSLCLQAAERRRADDKSCSHDSPSALREAEKAAQQSTGHDAVDLTLDEEMPSTAAAGGEGDIIDLISDDEGEGAVPGIVGKGKVFPPALAETEAAATGRQPKPSADLRNAEKTQTAVPLNHKNPTTDQTKSPKPVAQKQKPPSHQTYLHADGTWSCPTCTLDNPAHADRCLACDGLKPIDESVGWRCDFCYQYGSEHGFWMCRNCGAIRKRG